jgi:hypothetical protein
MDSASRHALGTGSDILGSVTTPSDPYSRLDYRRLIAWPERIQREVRLKGWRRREIEEVLEAAGFHDRTAFGGFDESPWEELESRNLILVAR